jgi:hypothetical protein
MTITSQKTVEASSASTLDAKIAEAISEGW